MKGSNEELYQCTNSVYKLPNVDTNTKVVIPMYLTNEPHNLVYPKLSLHYFASFYLLASANCAV